VRFENCPLGNLILLFSNKAPLANSGMGLYSKEVLRESALSKLFAALLLVVLVAAGRAETKVSHSDFGTMPNGAPVHIYTLTNKSGVEARIAEYGGRLVSLKTPDRKGTLGDVVLGFDSVKGFLESPSPFFGALIGRYGNRIGGARFVLGGIEYKLDKNDGANSLHGGALGFDKALWTVRELPDGGLELSYLSKDGEQGYPGNLKATAIYHVTDSNELRIDYAATTDKETVVNLTNHAYFNLKGSGDILGHVVTLNADQFTPVDAGLIPTGELRSVAGTPFDFRKSTAVGARIDQKDEQLTFGKGYDQNFVLNRKGAGLSLAAKVEEQSSGRVMEVLTTEPGVQFYTGNNLDGTIKGKGGQIYVRRAALCLETQHFPDSPNKPKFPSAVLKPEGQFHSTTVYRFSVAK
jgi:aldose 1-epimerase